jgi:hypothetical protein
MLIFGVMPQALTSIDQPLSTEPGCTLVGKEDSGNQAARRRQKRVFHSLYAKKARQMAVFERKAKA